MWWLIKPVYSRVSQIKCISQCIITEQVPTIPVLEVSLSEFSIKKLIWGHWWFILPMTFVPGPFHRPTMIHLLIMSWIRSLKRFRLYLCHCPWCYHDGKNFFCVSINPSIFFYYSNSWVGLEPIPALLKVYNNIYFNLNLDQTQSSRFAW